MNQTSYINEGHLDESEVPEKPIFSHSVKLEQTAKGVRVTVHVSSDNFHNARMQRRLENSRRTASTNRIEKWS